jgi:hypothetical protein
VISTGPPPYDDLATCLFSIRSDLSPLAGAATPLYITVTFQSLALECQYVPVCSTHPGPRHLMPALSLSLGGTICASTRAGR